MAKVQDIGEADFDSQVLKNTNPVLVDFWAPGCGPCRALVPVLDEVANDFDGRAKVAKVNIVDNGELAAKYGVQAVPTLVIFKGGQEFTRTVGLASKSSIADALNRALSG